jgi:hypothetical protein
MNWALIQNHRPLGLLLMVGAAVLTYTAARTAVTCLTRDSAWDAPSRRMFAHWFPIALTAILAVFLRQGTLAVCVIFSTTVVCLSLMLGILGYLSGSIVLPPPWRRASLLLLPTTILLLVIGFSGQFTVQHALCLILQGLLVLFACAERLPEASEVPLASSAPSHPMSGSAATLTSSPAKTRRSVPLATAELLLALLLAGLGAFAALLATRHLAQGSNGMTARGFMTILVSPILVLPMVGTGGSLAQRGQAWVASATAIGVALLNLCLLLPLVILVWHFAPILSIPDIDVGFNESATANQGFSAADSFDAASATTLPAGTAGSPTTVPTSAPAPATVPASEEDTNALESQEPASADVERPPLVYPLATWRIDAVLLIALALALMPVALNRWSLGSWGSILLVMVCVLYLTVSMAAELWS